jgi:alcohol dehydrogenase class IV
VHAGIAEARKSGCDGVLAVGGGSSIDAAKVISLGVNSDKDPLQHKGVISKPGVPLFAIPTTAGTGSEVSVAAVITDSKTQSKKGLGGPGVAPVATALDPILMQKLPPHITAATGMDALTHAIEAYVGIAGTHDTDRYALASARLIFENLPRAYQQGDDLKARQAMAIGASYGGFAINKAMVGYAHAIAHQLGAKYHVPHGLANAVLLPHVMAFSQQAAEQRMAEMARFAGLGSKTESDATLAQTLTDKVIELNKLLGIPEQLEQIKKEDYPQLIRAALKEGAGYPVPNFMTAAECEQILRAISVS